MPDTGVVPQAIKSILGTMCNDSNPTPSFISSTMAIDEEIGLFWTTDQPMHFSSLIDVPWPHFSEMKWNEFLERTTFGTTDAPHGWFCHQRRTGTQNLSIVASFPLLHRVTGISIHKVFQYKPILNHWIHEVSFVHEDGVAISTSAQTVVVPKRLWSDFPTRLWERAGNPCEIRQ